MAEENNEVVQLPYELTLGSNDKLIIHCDQVLPNEVTQMLAESVQEFLANKKRRVLFLVAGLKPLILHCSDET